MKNFMIRIIDKVDEFLSRIFGPIIEKIIIFLISGKYTLYVIIGLFITIIFLIGLFRWLFKKTKSFIIVTIIFAAIITVLLIFAS